MTTMSDNGFLELPIDEGLTVKFYPMRLLDLDELNSWIRSQAIRAATAAGVPISEAIGSVGSLSWATREGKAFLQSVEGTLKVLQISTRGQGLPKDLHHRIANNAKLVMNIWDCWSKMNAGSSDEGPPPPSQ